MTDRSSTVQAYGKYTGKNVNIWFKGDDDYTLYKLYNVYPDGTIEVIDEAGDEPYVSLFHLSDIKEISLLVSDTDITLEE